MSATVFSHHCDHLGEFSLQPFSIDEHSHQLHQWVNQPHAGFWGMGGYSLTDVVGAQRRLRDQGVEMYLGCHGDQPTFLLEVYRPETTELKHHLDLDRGDLGMHILIARPDGRPRSGFTLAVFHCIMEFLFQIKGATRVVVEPDANNHRVHALNRKVGFHHGRQVRLEEADKLALLATCTREQYELARAVSARQATSLAPDTAPHGKSDWQQVNRQLVAKAIAEFLHERLLQTEPLSAGRYRLCSQSGAEYEFSAEQLPLNHWLVDSASLCRKLNGQESPLALVEFIQEFQSPLGIDDTMLPTYLEEIASTVTGQLWKYRHPVASSNALMGADFQTLEQAMTEGHPCFVANSGKIGFDSEDFWRFAPETGQPIQLVWLAVHRACADFYSVDALSYDDHLRRELDLNQLHQFEQTLAGQGLSPADYWLMPAHPWQWHNQLQRLFAGEIAEQRLVYLGLGDDAYSAQQSIRTFYNRSRPTAAYVKCALSILNMGFMRGLSSKYMSVTPAINQWVYDTFANDEFLRSQPFHILREYAAIGYRHPQFDRGIMQASPYNKMLAALWRENPVAQLKEGQKAMTMAALLHVDRDGIALLPELIRASGHSTTHWLRRYLDIYLKPLLHCFYRHHMVFMPHGENLILVLEDHLPVAAYIKDIGEEVCLLNSGQQLPDAVARISVEVPEDVELLSIFTDVFDCFFRFVSAILYRHCDFPPREFWRLVAQCIRDYQAGQPDLQARFDQHDLFQSRFALSCLNRLQLRNNKQMLDLLNPADALQFAGHLENPVAEFAAVENAETETV